MKLSRILTLFLLMSVASVGLAAVKAEKDTKLDAEGLRLVPYPKQVKLTQGSFKPGARVTILVRDSAITKQAAEDLKTELERAAKAKCEVKTEPSTGGGIWSLLLIPAKDKAEKLPDGVPEQGDGYSLNVSSNSATVSSKTDVGLFYGIQTLRQLVRANMQGQAIPCLEIRDWPSLKYRGFQDDITRGISPTAATLEHEVQTAALLRMNFFTYYLEHQYEFKKHPLIGPKDGSLKPEELKKLVALGKRHNIEIIGCQQSFGHWATILHHEQYKHLRETEWILSPMLDESYELLEEMYSEQAPLTESSFFNVCCDETFGLGEGPSKDLAQRLGVGGVYAQHMRRIHDLLKQKYGKRMMMWGDIILQHPDHLHEIPKDTVMLSWGYHPADTFEPAVLPFKQSGYEFFVCPGVNGWGRMLPDFNSAVINIRNYVRDGAKYGTLGMLNTTWDDDAETFFALNWHGVAWGAECAWNASSTPVEDFNKRIGAVLFGEKGDHFGRAISLVSKAHQLPGYNALFNGRFWAFDDGNLPVNRALARKQAKALIDAVDPALEEFAALRKEATVNAALIDYFIFSTERVKLMATRWLDFIDAAEAYAQAQANIKDPRKASLQLDRALKIVEKVRDRHKGTKDQYRKLWLKESRPYALDWIEKRYDGLIVRYDDIATNLHKAATELKEKRTLPKASDVGLQLVEKGARNTTPSAAAVDPSAADVPWAEMSCRKRVSIVVKSGDLRRADLPVEVDLPAGVSVGKSTCLMEVGQGTSTQDPVPCQIEKTEKGSRLVFMVRGEVPPKSDREFLLYFDGDNDTAPVSERTVNVSDGSDGMKWIENDKIRLLIGPEGGHIYRWEVKDLGNCDITQPGETDWFGFADINGAHRNAKNRIEIVSKGDVLVRIRCTDDFGMEKTFSVWAGVPWIEVTLGAASSWFANYDDMDLMGADSHTPGNYLFSDGDTGKVKRNSTDLTCQARRPNVHWCAKYVPGMCMIGFVTPEVAAEHVVGPGGGMGAVLIESGASTAHFVIYGGMTPDSPKETMDRIRDTLDFRNQPVIEIGPVQTGSA